jgi:hypothetical protein
MHSLCPEPCFTYTLNPHSIILSPHSFTHLTLDLYRRYILSIAPVVCILMFNSTILLRPFTFSFHKFYIKPPTFPSLLLTSSHFHLSTPCHALITSISFCNSLSHLYSFNLILITLHPPTPIRPHAGFHNTLLTVVEPCFAFTTNVNQPPPLLPPPISFAMFC